MQKIGDKQIRRPKFVLFMDKDGTTDLNDKNLNNIFNLVSTMGGMLIFVTGRTVGDIEGELKRKHKKVPEIIAGDNGAVICFCKTGEILEQKTLEHEKVMKTVNYFIQNGGNKNNIRYTNGRDVFASQDKEIKEYYKENRNVIFCEDIYKCIDDTEEITKITLAGGKELMQKMTQFVETLDYWTDMDVTKFPKKSYQHYRLDIAQRNINKGEAVKWLVQNLEPEYGYMCVGNGANDVSMFKVAIDDNMSVAMMENTPQDVFEEMEQYAKNKNRGKIEKVPNDRNLANKYILKKAKAFQEQIMTKEKMVGKKQRLPNVMRVKVEGIKGRNISRGTGYHSKGRDR